MNKYLVCTFLLINALPAQALDWLTTTVGIGASVMVTGIYIKKQQDTSEQAKAQFEWCADKTGCETFTYTCNQITTYAQLAKAMVAEKIETTKCVTIKEDNQDSNDSLIHLIKTTTENTIASINDEIKKRSDLIDPQQMGKWQELMEGCQRGNQAQCEEVTRYSENIAKSAPGVGWQNKNLTRLKEGLLISQESILSAKDVDQLAAAIKQYNEVLNEFEAIKQADIDSAKQ